MSAYFSSLKISRKLYAGFGAMIALGLIIGTVAVVKNFMLTANMKAFDDMAGDALLASEINADMAKTLLNTNDYISTRDAKSLELTRKFLGETKDGIGIAKGEINKPERAERVAKIAKLITDYEAGLDKVVELYKERDVLVTQKLDQIGPRIRKSLSDINRGAKANGQLLQANLAGLANEHLLLGRLYVAKFLANNQAAEIDKAIEELTAAGKSIDQLQANTSNTAWLNSLNKVEAGLTEYRDTSIRVRELIFERNEIKNASVLGNGRVISNAAAEIKNSAIADEKIVAERTLASIVESNVIVIVVSLLAVAAGGFFGWFISGSIVKPIDSMTGTMGDLAEGNTGVEIPGADRVDEIGDMASAVQVFRDNMIESERLQEEQKKADAARAKAQEEAAQKDKERAEAEAEQARVAKERADRLNRITTEFETVAKEALTVFSSASEQMQASARDLTATADETSAQSTAVASASEEASTNVQTVASATEELSSSVEEISRQVANSAQIAREAVEESDKANDKVKGLESAATKIGEVVELINDIASQTNLLALNATIEAARAGEAGKGFAVVATEVKSLADQTAKATDEIGTQISEIQAATGHAVDAISAIGKTIRSVDEISGTIAAAVEEQGASTKEIAANIQQVASGSQEVNGSITSVNAAAGKTGNAANEVLTAAQRLSEQADNLRGAVDEFLQDVKAA